MTKPKKTSRQTAYEHWSWIESLLAKKQEEEKFLFIEGFVHGVKHGKENKK